MWQRWAKNTLTLVDGVELVEGVAVPVAMSGSGRRLLALAQRCPTRLTTPSNCGGWPKPKEFIIIIIIIIKDT
jgi:hypothetical protein